MIKITNFTVDDVRFPTSKDLIGSDAIHIDPDYSATYVTVYTSDNSLKGFGLAFTIGKGYDIVAECIKHFFPLFLSKVKLDFVKGSVLSISISQWIISRRWCLVFVCFNYLAEYSSLENKNDKDVYPLKGMKISK